MQYVLGVDGGGTQTFCVLADTEGNVLGRGQAGPSNYQAVGLPEAVQAVRQAIQNAVAGVPELALPVEAICLGLAGVDTPQDEALIRSQIQKLNLARQVFVVNDAEIALIGGTGGERGVAVIAGTGSVAFGSDGKGRKARAGGWGWILGDEGSAFYIGQHGLRAVVRALEGRCEATALVETLIRQWNLTDRDELTASLRARSWSRGDVADLAEWVTETARADDRVAQAILTRAGEELGLLATTVIQQLHMGGEFGVVLTGGVFQAGEVVKEPLWRKVQAAAPMARLVFPGHPPVSGAILMAWHKLGVSLGPDHLERISAMGSPKQFGGTVR